MVDIDGRIDALGADEARAALKRVLNAYSAPAFGALPKREADLMIFGEMTRLGIVPQDASLYQIMTGLRITRSRAAQLVFDREVRRAPTAADLDRLAADAIAGARFVQDGGFLMIEEENPLLHAHLRDRLKRLRHLTDASFNPAVIRMTVDAASALVVDLIPEDRRKDVKKALIAAGAPDGSIGHVVGHALRKLGGKAVSTGTDAVVDGLKEYLKPLVAAAPALIAAHWPAILG